MTVQPNRDALKSVNNQVITVHNKNNVWCNYQLSETSSKLINDNFSNTN